MSFYVTKISSGYRNSKNKNCNRLLMTMNILKKNALLTLRVPFSEQRRSL
jgi:hypothetical protein